MTTFCTVCKTSPIASEWEAKMMMCSGCADTLGVMPLRPARRPATPCTKCNGMRFIRAVPRELTQTQPNSRQLSSPMAVTYDIETTQNLYAGTETPKPVDTRKAFGYLEQYICQQCGFVEWYCNDPHNVPIGPQFMTEVIDYAGDTPYR